MCSTQLYSRTHFQSHPKKSSESNVAMCNVFLCFLQYLLHELKNCSVSEWQAALKSIDNMGWRKSDREESHFRDITVWRGMVSASKTAHSNPDPVFTSLYTPLPDLPYVTKNKNKQKTPKPSRARSEKVLQWIQWRNHLPRYRDNQLRAEQPMTITDLPAWQVKHLWKHLLPSWTILHTDFISTSLEFLNHKTQRQLAPEALVHRNH